MTDKEKYADIIVDNIGKIDEKYIYEAQTFTPRLRMPGYVKAAVAMAASLLLIISVMFPLAVVSRMRGAGNTAPSGKKDIPVSYSDMMFDALANTADKGYVTVPDGGAAVVWRTSDNLYHTAALDGKDADSILKNTREENYSGENTGVKIWIRTDNGDYFSPELKRSFGNIDRAVFDYSPEISVDGKTAEIIYKALKEDLAK